MTLTNENTYYWCFSHGTLHESDWCTAFKVPVTADSIEDAVRLKEYSWGKAQFLEELDGPKQSIVMEFWRGQSWRPYEVL